MTNCEEDRKMYDEAMCKFESEMKEFEASMNSQMYDQRKLSKRRPIAPQKPNSVMMHDNALEIIKRNTVEEID